MVIYKSRECDNHGISIARETFMNTLINQTYVGGIRDAGCKTWNYVEQ